MQSTIQNGEKNHDLQENNDLKRSVTTAVKELYIVMLQSDKIWRKEIFHKIYKTFYPCIILLCADLWCKCSTTIAFQNRETRMTQNMAQTLAPGRKSSHCPRKATLTHLFSRFKASLSASLLGIYSLSCTTDNIQNFGRMSATGEGVCHSVTSQGKQVYQSVCLGSWTPSGYGWQLFLQPNKYKRSFKVLRVIRDNEAQL